MTDVSTTKCSIYGGCYVTITGSGFPENKDVTQINFGRAPCKISSLTSTKVQCQINTARKVWFIDNTGIHPGGSSFVDTFPSVSVLVCPTRDTSSGVTTVTQLNTSLILYVTTHLSHSLCNSCYIYINVVTDTFLQCQLVCYIHWEGARRANWDISIGSRDTLVQLTRNS